MSIVPVLGEKQKMEKGEGQENQENNGQEGRIDGEPTIDAIKKLCGALGITGILYYSN